MLQPPSVAAIKMGPQEFELPGTQRSLSNLLKNFARFVFFAVNFSSSITEHRSGY